MAHCTGIIAWSSTEKDLGQVNTAIATPLIKAASIEAFIDAVGKYLTKPV